MIVFLLFIVAPLVELYVIIKTGQAIGIVPTIGLIILIALVGSWLIRREGAKVWNRFATQIQAGQVPSREIADGVCLLVAGALMLAPGFVSDVVALLLLFPPTRAVARTWLIRRRGLGAFRRATVIRAQYGGRMRDPRDVTNATGTEAGGELDP